MIKFRAAIGVLLFFLFCGAPPLFAKGLGAVSGDYRVDKGDSDKCIGGLVLVKRDDRKHEMLEVGSRKSFYLKAYSSKESMPAICAKCTDCKENFNSQRISEEKIETTSQVVCKQGGAKKIIREEATHLELKGDDLWMRVFEKDLATQKLRESYSCKWVKKRS